MAFRRLEYKLDKLNEELERRCYPQGIAYIINKLIFHTPEGREGLTYKELVTLAELGNIKTEHFHFSGWDEYRKMRKIIGDKDTFGKLWVKIQ